MARDVVMRLLAHDLRNPLSAVQLNAQLIERAATEAGLEKEQRWAALIAKAARRMDGMIQQLVEAERLRLGQLQLKRELVAWEQVWRDTLAENDMDLDPRRVRLALPGKRIMVSVDRDRLRCALRGLLCLALQEADGAAVVAVESKATDGEVVSAIHAPRASVMGSVYAPTTGADAVPPWVPGSAFHFARTTFECHGGSLRVKTGDSQAAGFELVLPTSTATSART